MPYLLPLAALALAILTSFVLRSKSSPPDSAPPLGSQWIALGVLTAISAFLIFRHAPEIDRTPALIALLLGVAAPILGRLSQAPLGFGVAAAAALHLLPAPSLPVAGLALIGGTGLAQLTGGSAVATLSAILVVLADQLGFRHSQAVAAPLLGSSVGVAASIATVLAVGLPARLNAARPLLFGIASAVGGFFIGKTLNEPSLGYAAGLGAVVGIALDFLFPGEQKESGETAPLIAAVLAVALATVSFGLGRGAGMAVAALAAFLVVLPVNNLRAASAIGPLLGLVLFRALREAGTGATRAIDLGQHYTTLALLLGIVLPLLPFAWEKGLRTSARAGGAFVWGLLAIAAAPVIILGLGVRGAIGYVIGLGVVGLIQALRNSEKPTLAPLAFGGSLGGAAILSLSWMGEESVLARDEKTRAIAYLAAAIAVAAVILYGLGRLKTEETSA